MNPLIRSETSADHEAIRHVNRLAFGQDAEARLVDGLWDGGYVRVSLVAEQASQVVGHILFSDLPIITEGGTVPALVGLARNNARNSSAAATLVMEAHSGVGGCPCVVEGLAL